MSAQLLKLSSHYSCVKLLKRCAVCIVILIALLSCFQEDDSQFNGRFSFISMTMVRCAYLTWLEIEIASKTWIFKYRIQVHLEFHFSLPTSQFVELPCGMADSLHIFNAAVILSNWKITANQWISSWYWTFETHYLPDFSMHNAKSL